MTSDTEHAKREAYRLFQQGNDPDGALKIVTSILNEHPDDLTCLFLAGQLLSAAHRYGLSNPLYRRVLALDPDCSEAWHNLAHSLHCQQRVPESIEAGLQSMRLAGDDFYTVNHMVLMNSICGDHRNAVRLAHHARFHASNAEERKNSDTNAALAYLALGDWPNGWRCFESMLGEMKQRKRHEFKGADDWDGPPLAAGQTLAVYGEQGIGDEIMFASILPDLKAAGIPFVVECEKRLAGLFQRSFGIPCYGTRLIKDQDGPERNWRDSYDFGAKAAIGSLGQFYRPSAASFPRVPYLKACPVRRKHIRGVLSQMPGRKIGLAWTGGLPSTRGRDRTLTPEAMRPILDACPGDTFISLEYKGEAPADPRILHWPEMLQSDDYDDTAGLVAELDMVVSVTTTVALLAGALGTPCHVLAPSAATWHWGAAGPCPWFGDWVRLYRRTGVDWESTIEAVAKAIPSPGSRRSTAQPQSSLLRELPLAAQ